MEKYPFIPYYNACILIIKKYKNFSKSNSKIYKSKTNPKRFSRKLGIDLQS